MDLSKAPPVGAAMPRLRIMPETPRFQTSSGKYIEEFTGHIVFWHRAKEFHLRPVVGEQVPEPDCASSDTVRPDEGENRQSELCATCSMNQNGSDIHGGPGKGCRRQIRLYVLMDDDLVPCLVKVGPWRLNRRDGLLRWLTFASHPDGEGSYRISKARFTLHTQKYGQVRASILDVETVRRLDPGAKADTKLLATLDWLYRRFHRKYHDRIAMSTPGSEYWRKKADRLWRDVIAKTGSCAYCGTRMYLEAHHLISRINSLTRHEVECGLCLCRYHHLYCPEISPHRQPAAFSRWLKKNVPDKYRWFQEHKRLPYKYEADYREAFLALSRNDASPTSGTERV